MYRFTLTINVFCQYVESIYVLAFISFGLTHVALLLTFAFLLAILLVDWLLCNSTTLLNRLLPHSCYGVAMIQCRFPIVLSL